MTLRELAFWLGGLPVGTFVVPWLAGGYRAIGHRVLRRVPEMRA